MSGTSDLKLAIASPNKFKYSETFIHAHVRGLPFENILLHGGYLPTLASPGLEGADESLVWTPWWKRLLSSTSMESPPGPSLAEGIRRFLKRNDIQVVLAEYGPTGVALMHICRRLQLPLLVHFHGYDAYRQDILGEQGQHYPALFRHATGMIVVSQHMRQQLLDLGAPADKIHLIPYGVDPDQFQAVDPAQNPAHLIGVGRFTDKKAPDLTIRAFALVAERFPEARLTLAGDGELWEACQALVKELGLRGRVELPGRIGPAEVAGLLAGGRGFVQHSVHPADGDSEGLPLAVLEAMATGLPVVATRHAGIPDAVRHGVEGLLCAEGDVEAMAEHMGQVLADGQFAARLGRAGRERVEAEFRVERYLGELAGLVRRVGIAK